MSKATTTRKVDYFRLPRPLWRKLKKHLPNLREADLRGTDLRRANLSGADLTGLLVPLT